jgi:thioesterase domain-containing protein
VNRVLIDAAKMLRAASRTVEYLAMCDPTDAEYEKKKTEVVGNINAALARIAAR